MLARLLILSVLPNKLFLVFVVICPAIVGAQTLVFSHDFENPNENDKIDKQFECRDDQYQLRTDGGFNGQYMRTKHDGDQTCPDPHSGKERHRTLFTFNHQDSRPVNNVWFEVKRHNWMGIAARWSSGPGGSGNTQRLSTIEPIACGQYYTGFVILQKTTNKLQVLVNWRENGTGTRHDQEIVSGWPYTPDQWHKIVIYYYPDWDNDGQFIMWVDGQKIVDHSGPNASNWPSLCDRVGHPGHEGLTIRNGLYGGRPGQITTADWDEFRLAIGGSPDAGINSTGYKMVYPGGSQRTPPTAPTGLEIGVR
jgi:hypothetical protein